MMDEQEVLSCGCTVDASEMKPLSYAEVCDKWIEAQHDLAAERAAHAETQRRLEFIRAECDRLADAWWPEEGIAPNGELRPLLSKTLARLEEMTAVAKAAEKVCRQLDRGDGVDYFDLSMLLTQAGYQPDDNTRWMDLNPIRVHVNCDPGDENEPRIRAGWCSTCQQPWDDLCQNYRDDCAYVDRDEQPERVSSRRRQAVIRSVVTSQRLAGVEVSEGQVAEIYDAVQGEPLPQIGDEQPEEGE